MSKNQRVDEGRLEAEHGELDYRDSSEDEEVMLLPHRKGADEPDPPGADIRDVPEASDTPQDEWLLKTEPLQGARPKWNKGGGGRPPVVPDRTGVLDIEAAGVWSAGTWRSDPSVATGSADHARGGSDNATEEGRSRTWGPSGS